VPDSRNQSPVSSSPGVRLLFRARPRRIRPTPSPVQHAHAHRTVPGTRVRLSWGSCSRKNATTSGAPAHPNSREAVREDEGRQTSVGAVLRVLAPLDGSGRARGASRALAEPAVYRGTPTLRGLVTCRSRPLGAALQSFPFPRSSSRSRGPVLPCGFATDCRQRGERSVSRSLSPSRQLFASGPPGGEPRRMSRDDGFPRSLGRAPRHTLVCRETLPFSFPPDSLVNSQHVRFEALLPPGVRSLATPSPWPGRGRRVGALLGISPRKPAPVATPGSVSHAGERDRGSWPRPRPSPRAQPSRLESETRAPTPGF